MIYRKYPYANKGEITDLRKRYVSNQALNALPLAKGVNGDFLYELIIKGGSIEKNDNKAATMVADAIESIIAAIYLDRGMKEAKKFILSNIVAEIDRY